MQRFRVFYICLCIVMLTNVSNTIHAQILEFPNSCFRIEAESVNEVIDVSLFPKIHLNSLLKHEELTKNTSRQTWAGRKIHQENFLKVDSSNYILIIDPAVHFEVGKELGYEPFLYENTRGIRIHGNLNGKLFFSSELYETQSVLPSYLEAFTDSFEVAPGLMRTKEFKDFGRDYATVYGMIGYIPNNHTQFVFARDKLHFGQGYRSMLLSHSAPASTYVMASYSRKKWSYHYILAALQNVSLQNIINVPQSSMGGYQNKYANFLIVSFQPFEAFTVNFFESMIWAPADDVYNRIRWQHINPLPFSRTIWYGLDNRNNAMVGIQLEVKLLSTLMLYGQYAIDEAGPINKSAIQCGLKYNGSVGLNDLITRFEYNSAGAYTYSSTDPLQSYSHYHHSLAHPFGANFREILVQSTVYRNRWIAWMMASYVQGGADMPGHATGQSIYGNQLVSGWKGSLFPKLSETSAAMVYGEARLHYIINQANGLNIFLSGSYRKTTGTLNPCQTIGLQGGISTQLRYHSKHHTWL